MKRLISISILVAAGWACLLASPVFGQEIQLHGKLIAAENDTVIITVWSDGELIGREVSADVFYSMILGEKPHYTIRFESGTKMKYCTLICHHMSFESIQVDVDFRSTQSLIVYKKRRNSKAYIVTYYGSGATREGTIKTYETE